MLLIIAQEGLGRVRREASPNPNPAMAATDAAKLSVSGAALAALLDCCGAAVGDCGGLLFGRAARPPAPPPSFDDDDPTPASSAPTLSISIAGHVSLAHPSSLSDALGCFQPYSPASSIAVGFFSSRRSATLRPSMREAAVARSLSKTLALNHPIVLLLVAPSSSSNLSVHSFDYRAFLLVGSLLVPASRSSTRVLVFGTSTIPSRRSRRCRGFRGRRQRVTALESRMRWMGWWTGSGWGG